MVLCLNGQTITMNDGSNKWPTAVIRVSGDVTFTLCDCQGTGTVTHGKNSAGETYDGSGVWVENNTYTAGAKANFVLYGGNISGNAYSGVAKSGAGVYLGENGHFTMHGGRISGNSSAGTGGGVCVYDAADASFTMTGGEITGNSAGFSGGGVYVSNCIFTMTGGTITNNSTDETGGGVYMTDKATVTLSGAPVITGNKGADGSEDNVFPDKWFGDETAFTVGEGGLTEGANIGVTVGDGALPTAAGEYVIIAKAAEGYTITDADADRVSADAGTDYTVRQKDNTLVLVKGELPHEHPICGDMSCTEHENALWTAISSLTNLAPGTENAPSRYYLTEDIELSKTWSAPKYMMLDLNGHTITANGDFDAIKVSGNKTFTLTDCKGTGKITHTDGKTGGGVYVGKYATFDMYGGSITGNTADNGGGVYVGFTGDGEKSYFNMYGGSITDNTATNGGGVYEGNGIFDMSGGSITGNTAQYGGGVKYGGSNGLTVSGNVQITGNKNTSDADDNVYVPIHSTAIPPSTPFHISNKGLDASARIGVSIGSTTLAAGGYLPVAWLDTSAVYNEGNFIADNGSGYVFLEEPSEYSTISGNVINLYNGMPHRHPVCGGDTCTGVGHTCDEKVTFKAWSGASGKLPTESGYYYLTDNMTLTTEWEPSEGSNIVLCLNGKTITAKVGTQDSASLTHDSIDIRKGVTVSVTDCVGTGTISRSTYYQRAVNVWGGTFNLYGGKITGFKVDSTSGGGVGIASNGIFNMYGGAITKNTSSYGGGGVHVGYFSQETIKQLWLPIPSADEQIEISNYLDEKCNSVDALIAKKQQYLTEIENYKKSLIYEYVTGKKEVV